MRGAHERRRSGRARGGHRNGGGHAPDRDAALLRGEARFLDDIPVAMPLHACFVRSPHAHARIVSIDLSAARAMPAWRRHAAADLYGELTEWRMPLGFALADLPANTTPFVLASSEVAFAGEAVAVVTAAPAEDGGGGPGTMRRWRPWPIARRARRGSRAQRAGIEPAAALYAGTRGLRGRVRRGGLGVRRALLDASRRRASDGRARCWRRRTRPAMR